MTDKDVVSGEHHRRNGPLAQESRKAQTTHIFHIASSQAHAFAAQLHPFETHDPPAVAEVDEDHRGAHDITQTRGECGAHHPPTEDEDENIVQRDVDDRRNCIAEHGIVGRPVETDEEHPRAEQGAEGQERREPVHVLHGQRQQTLRAAQQPGHPGSIPSDEEAVCRQQQRRDHHGLRHVDACDLDLPLRKVDRGYDRSPDAEHQPDARADEEQRGGDVDRGQGITADAAAHENPVRDDEHGRENHPQYGGDQQFPEQFRNIHAAEIDTVFHNSCFLDCKDRVFRPGKSYHLVKKAPPIFRRGLVCGVRAFPV